MKTDTRKKKPQQPQTPKFIEETFVVKVPQKEGEPKEVTYLYNFDKMSPARIIAGVEFFRLWIEAQGSPPETVDQVNILAKREKQRHAFSAILMRVDGTDEYESYIPFKVSSFEALDQIRGKSEWLKLEAIKTDFFFHTELQSIELTMQFGHTMQDLKKLKEADPALAERMMQAAENMNASTAV